MLLEGMSLLWKLATFLLGLILVSVRLKVLSFQTNHDYGSEDKAEPLVNISSMISSTL